MLYQLLNGNNYINNVLQSNHFVANRLNQNLAFTFWIVQFSVHEKRSEGTKREVKHKIDGKGENFRTYLEQNCVGFYLFKFIQNRVL